LFGIKRQHLITLLSPQTSCFRCDCECPQMLAQTFSARICIRLSVIMLQLCQQHVAVNKSCKIFASV